MLRQIYDQMSDPNWVISMGVCASSGGMFNNYAIVQGVDHIVPVDIYLPGCPPRPEMLLDSIVKLHDKIMNMKLGKNRDRQITELENARLACPRCTCPPPRDRSCERPGAAPAPQAGAEETHGAQAAQGPVPPAAEPRPPRPDENLPARLGEERLAEPVVRTGMFGVQDTPDTSGYGLLRVHRAPVLASPRPYGSYFDEVADVLGRALGGPGPASPTRSSGRSRTGAS